MRYQSESTISYIFRNFFSLLVLLILPSLVLGIFCADHSDVGFIQEFVTAEKTSETINAFSIELIRYFSILNLSDNWWVFLLGSVLLVMGESILMTRVQRHMRLGVSQFTVSLSRAASIMLPTAIYLLLNCLASLCLTFMGVGVTVLIGLSADVSAMALVVISIALQVVLKIGFIMLACLFICVIPAMQCEGYKMNIAASYSVKIVSRYYKKVSLACLAVFLIAAVFYYGVAIVAPFLKEVVSILTYLWWSLFVACYAERIYIQYEEVGRKDLKRILFDE